MMKEVALRTAVSSVVFFAFILVWRGEGFGQPQLVNAMFSTVIFALFYAAIRVGFIMFRNPDRDGS